MPFIQTTVPFPVGDTALTLPFSSPSNGNSSTTTSLNSGFTNKITLSAVYIQDDGGDARRALVKSNGNVTGTTITTSSGVSTGSVSFDVTPDINESGTASYFEASEIRAPCSILIYMGSPSRTFQINAKLISRTTAEAYATEQKVNILRSWRMPESSDYFSLGSENTDDSINIP